MIPVHSTSLRAPQKCREAQDRFSTGLATSKPGLRPERRLSALFPVTASHRRAELCRDGCQTSSHIATRIKIVAVAGGEAMAAVPIALLTRAYPPDEGPSP